MLSRCRACKWGGGFARGAGNIAAPAKESCMLHSEFLSTALEAARAAADVVRHYYQSNLKITIKADKSPVTEADVETEKTIRAILAGKFPAHGFYGEETGTHALDAEYVWVVDP